MSGAHAATRRAVLAVAAAAALAAAFAPPARGAVPDPAAGASVSDAITPAEQLIFTADHMQGVTPQTELDYSMVRSGEPKRDADMVRVLVLSPGNTKSDAQVSDRGGAVNLPNDGLACNPVIIYFLERDIAEMEQLTGGQRRYFQRRLRLALAAGPQISTVTSEIGGKPVAARRIVVQPYLHDPNAERFERYTGKRYTFLLADAVPGHVAMIRTEVPGANGDFAHPVETETLSFQSVVRKLPGKPGAPAAKPQDAPRASR